MILPYNRVVKDLNGLEKEGFLKKAEEKFEIHLMGKEAFAPDHRFQEQVLKADPEEWIHPALRPDLHSHIPALSSDRTILPPDTFQRFPSDPGQRSWNAERTAI